jgi:hypothetical protein
VFPRFAVVGANGTFSFADARVEEAWLVAATDVPFARLVRAPASVEVAAAQGRGWLLEGVVKNADGAALAADVVAWNGSALVSAARAGPSGVFALPLPPRPAELRIEARTGDNHFGGSRAIEVEGPPALRETIVAGALC